MAQAGYRQAPGGTSSICFGQDGSSDAPMSSNAYARGSSQNSGNVITDRPSTALHAPPGGKSTICLGSDGSDVSSAAVSSNAYAQGSSQNSGNVITDRPSTGLHAPPGGKSSICLGSDGSDVSSAAVSSNAYAQGSSQNSGNVITDRPSTALHAPPGGNTTICLGTYADDWKASSSNLVDQSSAIKAAEPSPRVAVGGEDHIVMGAGPVILGAEPAVRGSPGGEDHIVFGSSEQAVSTGNYAPPGGSATICLGTDAGQWKPSSATLVDQSSAVQAAEPSPRVPVGGEDHIVMGAGPQNVKASGGMPVGGVDHIAFGSIAKQDLAAEAARSSPATRAPPGGATTVMLGESGAASEWKATSSDLAGKVERDEAAEKKCLIVGQEPPTPARNVARAPPGGATTVMLG